MRKGSVGNIVMKVVIIGVAFFCFLNTGLYLISKYMEKVCTQQVQGIITDISVRTKEETAVDNGIYSGENSIRTFFKYTVDYEVNGKKFSNQEGETEYKYDKGSAVTVFYNPEKPSVHYVKEIYKSSKSLLNKTSFVTVTLLPFVIIILFSNRFAKIKKAYKPCV